jgi:hypothetical protein
MTHPCPRCGAELRAFSLALQWQHIKNCRGPVARIAAESWLRLAAPARQAQTVQP